MMSTSQEGEEDQTDKIKDNLPITNNENEQSSIKVGHKETAYQTYQNQEQPQYLESVKCEEVAVT